MTATRCGSCGKPIETRGLNYRNEPRWVHRHNGDIQCQMFAYPERQPDEDQ